MNATATINPEVSLTGKISDSKFEVPTQDEISVQKFGVEANGNLTKTVKVNPPNKVLALNIQSLKYPQLEEFVVKLNGFLKSAKKRDQTLRKN